MIGNEEFLTTEEAAKFLNYKSRSWFENVIVPKYNLKVYYQGLKKRPKLYKKADLEPLAGPHLMEEEK